MAGWRGRNHTPADGLGADLGYRESNRAGGAAGEIGGTIPGRGEDFVTYADTTLGGDPSQTDVLTASGRFCVDSVQPGFEGGFELGFFDGNTTVLDASGPSMGGVHDFVGVRFIDGGGDDGVLRWFARAGGLAGDTTTPLVVGETYLFDLAYDPNGAAPRQGLLSIDLRRASDGVSLGPATLSFASTGADGSERLRAGWARLRRQRAGRERVPRRFAVRPRGRTDYSASPGGDRNAGLRRCGRRRGGGGLDGISQ